MANPFILRSESDHPWTTPSLPRSAPENSSSSRRPHPRPRAPRLHGLDPPRSRMRHLTRKFEARNNPCRLLGRVVRPVPSGRPDPRGGRTRPRRSSAVRQTEHRREPADTGSVSDHVDPTMFALQERIVRRRASSVPCRRQKSNRFLPVGRSLASARNADYFARGPVASVSLLSDGPHVLHDPPERLRRLRIRMLDDDGCPASPPITIRGSSGIRPRNGRPSSFAAASPLRP